MIISRERAYIFVHIPKTGGTSLALALEGRARPSDILIGDTPKARRRRHRLRGLSAAGRLWKHATLADIDGVVGRNELSELYTFTLVRNPWDRVLSYYHWLNDQTFNHPSVTLARSLPFDGFLRHPQTRASLRDWPAGRYMQDADGVERCRLFIRLEHFTTDAAPLFDHLGFVVDLPRTNASGHVAGDRSAYTPALREIVADCCAEDIARFAYTFD